MKIFVDENIPSTTVQALLEIGHDVLDIRGTEYEGAADDVLWDMVQQERRLLIMTDKGFARYRDESHCGILIVRLRQPNLRRIRHRVMQAVANFRQRNGWDCWSRCGMWYKVSGGRTG
jgi:predicted nuclease of predicted toxin-antitoxin system